MADAADFAYAPDKAHESTWKLPIHDARHVGLAWAALSSNPPHGNRAKIPDADLAGVRSKIRAKAKALGVDLPGAGSSATEPPMAFAGMGPDDVHVDGMAQTAKPVGKGNFVTNLLARLKGHFGKTGAMSADEFAAHVRAARGHAGGRGKADAAAAGTGTGAPAAKTAADTDGSWWGWGAPSPDGGEAMDDDGQPIVLFEKADPRVNYRAATAVGHTCQDCQNFYEDCAACRLVEGTIAENATCDLFQPETEDEPQPIPMREPVKASELFDLCAHNQPLRLFAELPQAFAEPPEWIPYLPLPGTHESPAYGTVPLPPDRLERFVTQFNSGVYQNPIPIDLEHDTKLSGAAGWITALRQNSDGSVDAKSQWTDRGEAAIRADRFKFISPEWYDEWPDPLTGHVYKDVAIGCALTTRPFFKPGSLRPLAASERASFAIGEPLPVVAAEQPAEQEATRMDQVLKSTPAPAATPPTPAAPTPTPIAATEPTAQTAGDAKSFAELRSQLDAYKAMAESNAATAKQAMEAVAKITRDSRHKTFTDMVLGRGGTADGAAWAGEIAKNVSTLELLADSLGEDSDAFKSFVEAQQSVAAQLAESAIYHTYGTSRPGGSGGTAAGPSNDPEQELVRQAHELVTADPTLSMGDAMYRVAADPRNRKTASEARVKSASFKPDPNARYDR